MLIDILARTSELDRDRIERIAHSASARYKVYQIPKRNGGHRTIAHPSQELKAIQRWLVKAVFNRFAIHEAATAYRPGGGIRVNAERHRTTLFTTRYDFSSFFASFKEPQIREFIRSKSPALGIELEDEDIWFICQVVCRHGRLTIGAPSSPSITNAMMFDFDAEMYSYALDENLVYTRYADDIFVSAYAPYRLADVEDQIRTVKRAIPHLNLRINRRKTTYLSRKYRRSITGVIITPDQRLSLGRERKRYIKGLIHRWRSGKLPPDEFHMMMGLVAFASDVEPAFEESLRTKYGDEAIDLILGGPSHEQIGDIPF